MARSIVLPSLTGLPRLPDASSRLAELVLRRLGVAFCWGVHDCVLWAADAVAAQLGTDPAREVRGTYSTQQQALRLLAKVGGLHGLASCVLGQPMPPLLCRVGDIGLMHCGAMGVCGGDTWLVIARGGLGHMALADARHAWRVGHA